uniref:glycosyltransferase family 4 protein n=6 Tax=Vibrio vulnificus TaxID=672 RepID=UPI000BDCF584
MNILYISSFVYKKNSSAAIRNNKLIEGLVSLGCKVSVLTINYSDEWTDKALLENHRRLNISIFSSDILSASDITSNSSKQTIKKFLPKEVYKLMKNLVAFPDVDKDWLKEIFNIEDKYELVISSSDTKTSHFVAEKIFNEHKLKSKWVQIWGDPWATDVNLDFFTRKCVSLSESRLLKKASKIFYVSELTSLEYKDKYPEISDKIHHVGRSFYKKIAVNKSNTQKDSITIFYPGALNDNRVITDLCE